MSDTITDDRSIAQLIKELRNESTALLQQEVQLVKTEMSEKGSRLLRNCGYLMAGVLVVLLGAIFLLRAISEGISVALADAGLPATAQWLGPLIVGMVVSVIGVVLAQKAMSTLKDTSLVPKKTLSTLK